MVFPLHCYLDLFSFIIQVLFHPMVAHIHWQHVKSGFIIIVQDNMILMLRTVHLSSSTGSNHPMCVIPHTALVMCYIKNHDLNGFLFSSPELIAQASFSDPFCPAFVCLTISPLSVHSTVSLSAVCPTVNVLHVRLLLQNHRSNFNQTKAKAYCMKGI